MKNKLVAYFSASGVTKKVAESASFVAEKLMNRITDTEIQNYVDIIMKARYNEQCS